ncbi:MAG: DUF2344 domain-containing protein [Anaerolineae bacterium]|nr:DUF2344 domain-containing protein [Anaerolineae bacterium]
MASALPLGFTSRCEVADVWLTITTDPEDIQQRLQASSPPGFMIHSVAQVDYNLPALQTLVRSAEFIVTLRQLPEGYDLSREVEKLLALPEILRTRREKVYDLRALILEIEVLPAANPAAYPGLRMQLSAREGATGRPEEVLDALGLDPATTRVEKIAMELSQTSPA